MGEHGRTSSYLPRQQRHRHSSCACVPWSRRTNPKSPRDAIGGEIQVPSACRLAHVWSSWCESESCCNLPRCGFQCNLVSRYWPDRFSWPAPEAVRVESERNGATAELARKLRTRPPRPDPRFNLEAEAQSRADAPSTRDQVEAARAARRAKRDPAPLTFKEVAEAALQRPAAGKALAFTGALPPSR